MPLAADGGRCDFIRPTGRSEDADQDYQQDIQHHFASAKDGDQRHGDVFRFSSSGTTSAAIKRKAAFADAAKGRYWIAAAHIPYPGFGYLKVDGSGYRWVPIAYVNDYYERK